MPPVNLVDKTNPPILWDLPFRYSIVSYKVIGINYRNLSNGFMVRYNRLGEKVHFECETLRNSTEDFLLKF